MRVLSKISGGLVKSLLGEVRSFVTNKADKAALEIKFTELVNNHDQVIQEQVTERHKSDMTSDSWLAKNIRPLTLIFILITYSVFSMADGNLMIGDHSFNINEDYVTLLGEWGKAIMYFYFGGRTIEKGLQVFKKK